MTNTEQNNEQLKLLVQDVLKFGDLLLIANKGIGKTNALMVLAEQFRKEPNTKVIIFEDFPKIALEFSEIPYIVIHDSDVKETNHTVDLEDYFLRHERDYAVLRGSEIQQALENNKDLIFVSEITDIERQAFLIYSVIQHFYRQNYRAKWRGYNNSRIVFIIEESQNVFDSSTISKKIFNRLRKIFSVARNLDIHFVLCSQRLQDLNTKIRGRTRLLIGQVSLDDYELKIRRLLRHSQHREAILTLDRGKFLYTALDLIVSFPKWQAIGKPYLWQLKEKIKPQTDLASKFEEWQIPKPKKKEHPIMTLLKLPYRLLTLDFRKRESELDDSEPKEYCESCGCELTEINRAETDTNLCQQCQDDRAVEEEFEEF